MYKAKLEKDIRSPLDYGLDMFGGKWKARILSTLGAEGPLRYSQLRQEMGNISDTVLSSVLKELIADQMILRHSYDEIPPRVEYCLTEKGQSVAPLLQSICLWARYYQDRDYRNTLPHCKKCEQKYGLTGRGSVKSFSQIRLQALGERS